MGMKIKRTMGERVGHGIIIFLLTLFAFACIYPFWHVLMYSISDSREAMTGGLFLVPRSPTFLSYSMIFKTRQIYVAYSNTILRTLFGTLLSVLLTALTAFPLSLKRMRGRQFFSMMIFFTMLFNGGLIPTFLVVQDLGLLDTFLALILPNAMSAYNMFILRNYFQQLPESLEESAYIDGANPFIVLFRIILPIWAPSWQLLPCSTVSPTGILISSGFCSQDAQGHPCTGKQEGCQGKGQGCSRSAEGNEAEGSCQEGGGQHRGNADLL